MMESKSNEKWHLSWEGKVYGPFDFEEIISMAAKGQFDPHISYVWKPGFEGWKPCMELEAFRVIVFNPPSTAPSCAALRTAWYPDHRKRIAIFKGGSFIKWPGDPA